MRHLPKQQHDSRPGTALAAPNAFRHDRGN
jgi:hypothetical protein